MEGFEERRQTPNGFTPNGFILKVKEAIEYGLGKVLSPGALKEIERVAGNGPKFDIGPNLKPEQKLENDAETPEIR